MRRLTLEFPEELEAELRLHAAEAGMTVEEFARHAIEEHLGTRRKRSAPIAGELRDDAAEHIEEILPPPAIR